MRPLHAAEKAERARRSVFVYLPNGVNTYEYEIAQAGRDYKFQMSSPLLLARSEQDRKKLRCNLSSDEELANCWLL